MAGLPTDTVALAEVSRQLGFLRFRSIDDSRDFLEPNHPFIYLYGPNAGDDDRSTKVRIAYSREREDRAHAKAEGDWTCRMVGSLRFQSPTSAKLNVTSVVCRDQLCYPPKVLSLQCSPSWLVQSLQFYRSDTNAA